MIAAARDRLIERLLAERNASGHWSGELASSALSTATASIALHLAEPGNALTAKGLDWLELTQNDDGGWGDTVLSISNISTTALCWAALTIGGRESDAAEVWMLNAAGSLEPWDLAQAITARYGKDHTFSVPILTTLAIAGIVPWDYVPALPFELAAFPREWYSVLGLPVVSYALPALIAIGHVHHRLAPSPNPILRFARKRAAARTLKILEGIQPENGGFLEATPLTSFVSMSLCAAGYTDHPVLALGLQFLRNSMQPDGSWPIDTNLATWVTTLSVNALGNHLPAEGRAPIRDWLLSQQYKTVHPYTGAAPGAWSWTDLPGGVPDADDTPGALLALAKLDPHNPGVIAAASNGVQWLLDLQNRDGGIPTFCRGWGKLPFDRSSPDLTAHTLHAWSVWKSVNPRTEDAMNRALHFLEGAQRADGAWVPLWFGNQYARNDENPVYGTARVLASLQHVQPESEMTVDAVMWLLDVQNDDGGWGGDRGVASSIEETALAVSALHGFFGQSVAVAIEGGVNWLVEATKGGEETPPTPIGFYFAKLWYFEKLYPLIFAADALGRVMPHFES